ncbi:MAG: hypothetical protein RL616_1325 [Verrucomicrobiota bacterium]
MQSPSNFNFGWLKKISAGHLPIILLIALALRLLYAFQADGNAFGNQNDGMEAYEVATHYEAGEDRAQYLSHANCNQNSKLPGVLWTLTCVAGIKLTHSVSGILLLTIFLNLIAIALTWKLARDLFDEKTASLGALFLAVSPWAVHYSAIIYNPSPMPLFGAVIFLALFRCVRHAKSAAIFWLPLLVIIGPQFHMSTLSLIAPLLVFGWLMRLKPSWSWLVAGVLAAVVCYLPYALGDARHDWANTRGMMFGGAGKFSADALKVITSPFSFLINYWYPGWTYAPGDYPALARRTFGGMAGLVIVNLISVGFAVLSVCGVVCAVKPLLKNFRAAPREFLLRSPALLSVVFLLLAYLFFNLIAGKPFHARYCLLVLPLLFTLAGFGAARCLESARLNKYFLPLLLVTLAANLWFMTAMCRFEHDRITDGAVFVPGYAKLESVYRQLKTTAETKVEVRDRDYLTALPPGEKNNIYRHVGLLRRYVACREMELQTAGKVFANTNFFELRAAALVQSNDVAVKFYGNGIALVAVKE